MCTVCTGDRVEHAHWPVVVCYVVVGGLKPAFGSIRKSTIALDSCAGVWG